jgi:hypothetical protein
MAASDRPRVAEWIVVSARTATPEEKMFLARAPARWIERSAIRYYGLKNEGIRQARGRFIAPADSDALPADDWLDFVGRMRALLARWREFRRPMGIALRRLPLSLFFFAGFSTVVAHGHKMAARGRPEPFARF